MNDTAEKKEVMVRTPEDSAFETIQRKAKLYTASELVPKIYQGNTPSALANAVIALNLAHRIGADELMVMQNLYVIQGRPSWSSTFIISALNSCGKFSPIRFKMADLGAIQHNTKAMKNIECRAVALDNHTGESLEGPPVSIVMAIAEGWYDKNGSKWQTMPELMLRYRAAAFFGRLYAPEILNGLHTVEEVGDMDLRDVTPREPEDIVKEAEAGKPSATKPSAGESPEDLWAHILEYGAADDLPEAAKKDIQAAIDRDEKDPILLRALLNKVKAAYDGRKK